MVDLMIFIMKLLGGFLTKFLQKEAQMNYNDVKIIKKTGELEAFNKEKIISAVNKSAERVNEKLSTEDLEKICDLVEGEIEKAGEENVPVLKMHTYAELALDKVNPKVAAAYKEYRNYKQDFVHIMDDVLKMNQGIMYLADKSNANTDSSITSTKRSLLYKKLSKELYQKVFLTPEERSAITDGYFYIHD